MDFQHCLYLLDLAGTFIFAVSGVLAAISRRMDIFGMLVLAVVTASGGGMLRSVLIGDTPVPFLRDPWYLITCIIATGITFLLRSHFIKRPRAMAVFDSFGLGIFLSLGVAIALQQHLSYWTAVLLGMMTASFGGLIRDVLCAETPLILRRELYATACITGGIVYITLFHAHAPQALTVGAAASTTIAVRLLSMRYNWHLPR